MKQVQNSKVLTAIHIALIIAGIYILWSFSSSIYRLWKKGDVVFDKQKYLKTIEKEQDQLKTELSYTLKSTFIEEEARNKLNLVKPGETLVIVPNASVSAKNEYGSDSLSEKEMFHESIVRRWWKVFLGM
jgi:cell division protein FtsB